MVLGGEISDQWHVYKYFLSGGEKEERRRKSGVGMVQVEIKGDEWMV